MIDVNLNPVYHVTQAGAPMMVEASGFLIAN
jgi:NADP-dependent 3-hydroxy acid dehydrogenase YdfG